MRRYTVALNDKEFEVTLIKKDLEKIVFEHNQKTYSVSVRSKLSKKNSKGATTTNQSAIKEVKAPMPGIVVQIPVKPGDSVKIGQALVVIEAMKMENALKAQRDGTIGQILIKEKQEVSSGQLLITFL